MGQGRGSSVPARVRATVRALGLPDSDGNSAGNAGAGTEGGAAHRPGQRVRQRFGSRRPEEASAGDPDDCLAARTAAFHLVQGVDDATEGERRPHQGRQPA